MSIFSKTGGGNNTQNSELFGYKVQTSLVGKVIPKVQGRVKLAPNVIWLGDWIAIANNGGKGNKGKGGSQTYDYQCATLLGLCGGVVTGVYNIWSNKDQYNLQFNTATYTVPSGGGTYTTPQNGAVWFLNCSVTRGDTYSVTANDYGSPGSSTLSGTQQTPMEIVPSITGAGQYTLAVTSSGAEYTFGAADAGKVITITYSYDIPANSNTTVSFSTTSDPLTHLNLSLFVGQQGQAPCNWLLNAFPYQALGYTELAYVASANIDLGSAGVLPNLNFEVQAGPSAPGQTYGDCNPADMIRDILTNPLDGVLGWVTSTGSTSGYGLISVSGICNIDATGLNMTGTSGSSFTQLLPNSSISINGQSAIVASIGGSTSIVLNAPGVPEQTGAVWTATVFASYSQITGQSSYLPSTGQSIAIDNTGEVYAYCAANGIFLSLLMDSEQDARDWLNDILLAANADAFWSEGVLKFRSYGDTTAVGNGFTFTPNTQPIYDIDDADLITPEKGEPIDAPAPDVRDVKNQIAVEWLNRSMSYAQNTVVEEDLCSVLQYGPRPESTKSLHGICQQEVAELIATTMVRRSVYITGAGQIKIELPMYFMLLDCMDIITLTDPNLGLYKTPFRVVEIEETDKLTLRMTLEVFPWSVSAPTLYPKQGAVATQAGFYANPGLVNTPMFVQLPPEVANGNQSVVGIALSGQQNWGGAVVYVSTDGGNSYVMLGTQTGAATMGVLTASLAVTGDPDTTANALQLNLSQSFGELISYTQGQADALVSLIAVDQELMSYETAALTGTAAYSLTYLRRGVYDTDVASHASGAPFCTVDGLFQYQYPASAIGKTIYFKFCSVNLAGGRTNDISQVQAYPYFVVGPRAPYRLNASYESPISGDPLFSSETFGINVNYSANQANGTPQPQITVLGNTPIDVFSTTIGAPSITSVTVSSGGSISGGANGITYLIAVNAFDAATNPNTSPLSNVYSITVPPGSGYKLSVTVAWPTGSYGGDAYAAVGDTNLGLGMQPGSFGAGSSTSGSVTYNLTSIVTGLTGPPDQQFDHVVATVRREFVSGVFAQEAAAVSTNTLNFGLTGSLGTGTVVGRIITKLANAVGSTANLPIQDFTITAYNTSTGNFTVTPDPGPSGANCQPGDFFTLRMQPTSATATGFTDTLLLNSYNTGGLSTAGTGNSTNLAIVIGGTGAGQAPVTVTGNTNNSVTVSPAFAITPDSTSVIVLVESAPQVTLTCDPVLLANYASPWSPMICNIPIPNYAGQVVRVEVYTANSDGVTGAQQYVAAREAYVFGAQGTRVVTASE